jgi:hypothetical protein
MADKRWLPSEADAKRISRVVRQVEQMPGGSGQRPGRAVFLSPLVHLIECTGDLGAGSAPFSDWAPGTIQAYDVSTNSVSDLGDCWLWDANDLNLSSGHFYQCRCIAQHTDGKLVFVAEGGVLEERCYKIPWDIDCSGDRAVVIYKYIRGPIRITDEPCIDQPPDAPSPGPGPGPAPPPPDDPPIPPPDDPMPPGNPKPPTRGGSGGGSGDDPYPWKPQGGGGSRGWDEPPPPIPIPTKPGGYGLPPGTFLGDALIENPVLYPNQGGTGLDVYAAGDVLYASGTGTLARLAASAGKFLGWDGGGAIGAYSAGGGATEISPAALTASVNDYAPTGLADRVLIRLTTDGGGPYTITGLDATGIAGGAEITIVNIHATDSIVFTHEDAASSAANRFDNQGGFGYTAAAGGRTKFIYDATTQRWRRFAS